VQQWLEDHEGWLMILDNADEPEQVEELFPDTSGNRHILLTRGAAQAGTAVMQVVDTMDQGSSETLLVKRAGRSWKELRGSERAAVQQIASLVAGLPLAVDQAGAYVGQTGCSFSEYLEQYKTYEAQLLDEPMWGERHGRSVIATLRISVSRVSASDAAAQELMRACVFLHADGIPMALLMGGVVQQIDKFANSPSGGSMKMAVNEAIGTLMRFSLVHRGQVEPSAGTHV